MKTRIVTMLLLTLPVVAGHPIVAQRPVNVAPAAPRDRAVPMDSCIALAAQRAMAPLILQARASYPSARARFMVGLPQGQSLFAVTRIHDSLNRVEQVFVAVDSIRRNARGSGEIVGRIWSAVTVVTGYKLRQRYAFREEELVDWLVTHPDGSEEGNAIGKFMDNWQPPASCRP